MSSETAMVDVRERPMPISAIWVCWVTLSSKGAVKAASQSLSLDPQGDLVQFLRMHSDEHLEVPERARFRVYRERVEPRIFTSGSSHGLRLRLSPIRLTSSEDLARIKDVTRRQEEQEAILSALANNRVSLAQAGGEQDAQRTFLYRLLEAMPRSKHLQGLGNQLIEASAANTNAGQGRIRRRERLGGLLNVYYRDAA